MLGFHTIFPYSPVQMATVYHRTSASAAEALLRNGFPRGVWLRFLNVPFETKEEAHQENALLSVVLDRKKALLLVLLDVDDEDLKEYAGCKNKAPYEEWTIPGEIVNDYSLSIQIIREPAIVQEDLKIKELELDLRAKVYKSLASALEKKHIEALDCTDPDLPQKEAHDLMARRIAFEATLIENSRWNCPPNVR